MSDVTPAFSGEVMLLAWKESSTQGRTVTFLLNEDDEVHPFKDLTTKAGKRAGQRFMAVLVALSDDDQPEAPRLSQTAAILCRDPSFWEWASSLGWDVIANEDDAKRYIYRETVIDSRSKLDTDERAANLFRIIERRFRGARSVFGGEQ